MRIVFMGTPQYAATILEELSFQHDVVAVYTRPDAVRGRGSKLVPSPVKECAVRLGLPVFTPRTLRDGEVLAELEALGPDAICVAAYGMILPKAVLDVPPLGCLNAHASLLPRWRGAAPIERAILAGDEETGVCIMLMEEGLDTGPYSVCRSTFIGEKTAAELTDELAELAAAAMLSALARVEAGVPGWTPQADAGMTYAEKVRKEELLLSPADSVQQLARKVQASNDAHPARCIIGGRPVAVVRGRALADDEDIPASVIAQLAGSAPGAVRFAAKRLFLVANDGAYEVQQVKPDGKQVMEAQAFAAGLQGVKAKTVEWGPWHAA